MRTLSLNHIVCSKNEKKIAITRGRIIYSLQTNKYINWCFLAKIVSSSNCTLFCILEHFEALLTQTSLVLWLKMNGLWHTKLLHAFIQCIVVSVRNSGKRKSFHDNVHTCVVVNFWKESFDHNQFNFEIFCSSSHVASLEFEFSIT